MVANTSAPSTPAESGPKARSEAERKAAAENGRRGSGPQTEAGKLRSRENALRHGHRAEHPDLLPADLRAAVAAELAVFEAAFRPRDDYERRLVAQAAAASARFARLSGAELAHAEERARRALGRWDALRAAEVEGLAEKLYTSPRRAVERLRTTAAGCDHLADLWTALADTLAVGGTWSEYERSEALRLLGHSREPGPEADPEAAATRLARLSRAGTAEARAELLALVESLLAELVERSATLWDRLDRPDRAGAPDRALFDPSPEGKLLARYLAEAERQQRRATAELDRHRRRAPNEPEREGAPPAEPQRPQGEGESAPRPPFASSAALREFFPASPSPNEPEPSPAIEPRPLPLAADPAARKRRPDPAKLLRRARR